jgi:hypothetical protein
MACGGRVLWSPDTVRELIEYQGDSTYAQLLPRLGLLTIIVQGLALGERP